MHITSWNPSLRSDESTSANNAFELNGFYRGLGSLVVRGRAFFNDGRVREVQQRFQFARASRQNLRLAFTDRYFGRISDQPNWEWTVQVKGSLAEISDIRQVVYHLHPTFPTPDRAVAGTPENGFAFTTIGWGGFPLRATLYFKDSSTAELNGAVQFRDPVRNELSLKNVARPSGTSISIPK